MAIWGGKKINHELRRLRRAEVHARVGPATAFDPTLTAESAPEQLTRAIAAMLPEEYRGVYA